jgi:hypothetical protein
VSEVVRAVVTERRDDQDPVHFFADFALIHGLFAQWRWVIWNKREVHARSWPSRSRTWPAAEATVGRGARSL